MFSSLVLHWSVDGVCSSYRDARSHGRGRARRERGCGRGRAGISASGPMHDDWDDLPRSSVGGVVRNMA
eukprot:626492-Karenia_brevis.AAC.1